MPRRLEEAKKWFSQTYENADLRIWYFNSHELRLPNSPLKKAVLAKKLLNYIQSGELTIPGSFKFQNVGAVIQSVELTDKDEKG